MGFCYFLMNPFIQILALILHLYSVIIIHNESNPILAKQKKKYHRGFSVFSCFPCSHMLSSFSCSPFTMGWMLFYHLLTSQSPRIKYTNSACSSCHCFILHFFLSFSSLIHYIQIFHQYFIILGVLLVIAM